MPMLVLLLLFLILPDALNRVSAQGDLQLTTTPGVDIQGADVDCGQTAGAKCRQCGQLNLVAAYCRTLPTCVALVQSESCSYLKTATEPKVKNPPPAPESPPPESTQPTAASPAPSSPPASPVAAATSPEPLSSILQSGPAGAVIDAGAKDSAQTQDVRDSCGNAEADPCSKACACAVGRFGRKVVQNPSYPTLKDEHVVCAWQVMKSLIASGALPAVAWDNWTKPECQAGGAPLNPTTMEDALQLLIGPAC